MRDPHPKNAQRCDPADPTPHAAYSGRHPELDVDDRIRNVVRAMVGQLADDAPSVSPEDLARLAELDGDDSFITPYQMAAMDTESPARDFDRFLKTLKPEEVSELRDLLRIAESAAPPAGAVAAEPPATPPEGTDP